MRIVSFGAGSVHPDSTGESGGIHPDSCELLYISSGTVRFHWTAHSCLAQAPALFIVPPNTPHILTTAGDEAASYLYLVVDIQDLLTGMDSPQLDIHRWNKLQAFQDPDANSLFTAKIFESMEFVHQLYMSGKAGSDREIERACEYEVAKMVSLMAHLSLCGRSDSMETTIPSKKRKTAEEAVVIMTEYLEWRYREPVTIEILAKLVHMNPSYAIRIFREYTGSTPTQYLQNLRIKAAASFLTGSDMPIRLIAEQTGFNSVHYFTRLFRQMYGDSPANWRNRLK
ncbi:AraC family transcriptional regulator [Paenibacillus nasutitermitis]|uniref:HTH araC/xylS-type domain-containing protein n=1 Tax=Paenibacillus nasutitermitis TaxID=1652958 RepID=A0A916YMW2_9BACL|nr:AraC family transcriptional regulator [Paenibacillus nasutitermitis]GGD51605.1 hypothetical protein GCM10010911_06450 [Paenibacillus nasutitermitis]